MEAGNCGAEAEGQDLKEPGQLSKQGVRSALVAVGPVLCPAHECGGPITWGFCLVSSMACPKSATRVRPPSADPHQLWRRNPAREHRPGDALPGQHGLVHQDCEQPRG